MTTIAPRTRDDLEAVAPAGAPAPSDFILELPGAVRPGMRLWVRGPLTDPPWAARPRVLIVTTCTCGWRAEVPVRCPSPDVRSPRVFAAMIADAGVDGFLPEHSGCGRALSGRWRSTECRIPLWVPPAVGSRIDSIVEPVLVAAYEMARTLGRQPPGMSIDYLAMRADAEMTHHTFTVAPSPFTRGLSEHDRMDDLHFALRGAAARVGGSVVAAVLTLRGWVRRPRAVDVIVVTRNGAFRKQLGGSRDGYCRDWVAVMAPHGAVDGLLVGADA